jgi:hypothetical protein
LQAFWNLRNLFLKFGKVPFLFNVYMVNTLFFDWYTNPSVSITRTIFFHSVIYTRLTWIMSKVKTPTETKNAERKRQKEKCRKQRTNYIFDLFPFDVFLSTFSLSTFLLSTLFR